MPRVLSVDPQRPQAAVLDEALRLLQKGGLVAFPTETVYGLGARALDEDAVRRVFAAKGRPAQHPLIAHVQGESQARSLALSWPEAASRLADALWPGPLTLVVDRAPHVPPAVAGGSDSIAVRAPAHIVAQALIGALGEPIAAPSANRYQGVSPTTAAHVLKQLGDEVDLVLDGGPCRAGIESTVVDVRGEVVRVLRPGAVDMATLRDLIPGIAIHRQPVASDRSRAAPGMGARHYAPRARLVLAESCEAARDAARELAALGARVGLVVYDPPGVSASAALADNVLIHTLARDPLQYANRLYATLHDLDDAGVSAIVVQRVPSDESWWAIADRLQRGSSQAR